MGAITLSDVGVGSAPNDGTGDPLRTAYQTINSNNSNIENLMPGFYEFSTGALTANVTKTVTHSKGWTQYIIQARDSDNNVAVKLLKKNAGDPTNKVDIKVGIDMPSGLTIQICGL